MLRWLWRNWDHPGCLLLLVAGACVVAYWMILYGGR